ncbi:MAG: hypothetical protein ACI4P4_03230 [Faecousia sp.]
MKSICFIWLANMRKHFIFPYTGKVSAPHLQTPQGVFPLMFLYASLVFHYGGANRAMAGEEIFRLRLRQELLSGYGRHLSLVGAFQRGSLYDPDNLHKLHRATLEQWTKEITRLFFPKELKKTVVFRMMQKAS